MSQVNIQKTEVFEKPFTNAKAYGFDINGNPVMVNEDGSVTILGVNVEVVSNVLANLGVGPASGLPTSFNPGDIYVTWDTRKIYTAHDSVSWDITDLQNNQYVTSVGVLNNYLFQFKNNFLYSIGLTNGAQTIEGVKTFGSFPLTPSSAPTEDYQVANRRFVLDTAGGLWDDRGNYDASTDLFPATGGSGTAGAIKKADVWLITVGGTLGGVDVVEGQTVRALIDDPGQTAGNWAISAGTLVKDSTALHTDIAAEINGLTEKTVLEDNDEIVGETSTGGVWTKIKIKLSSIRTHLGLIFGTSTSDLKPDGTASLGVLNTIPRMDHVHPTGSKVIYGGAEIVIPGDVEIIQTASNGQAWDLPIGQPFIQTFRNEIVGSEYMEAFNVVSVWMWGYSIVNMELFRGGVDGLLLNSKTVTLTGNGTYYSFDISAYPASPLELFTIRITRTGANPDAGVLKCNPPYAYANASLNGVTLETSAYFQVRANAVSYTEPVNTVEVDANGVLFKIGGVDAFRIDTTGKLVSLTTGYESLVLNDNDIPNKKWVIDNGLAVDLSGLWDDRGNYDASSNLFPSTGGSGTAGAVKKADTWTVTVPGALGGTAVIVGQVIRALQDTPGQTAANWNLSAGGGSLDINGLTAKTTPVDADVFVIEDSETTPTAFGKKKLSWANIKATLKTYFDGFFAVQNPGISAKTPITAADISINYTTRVLTITPPLGYFDFGVDGGGTITTYRKTGNVDFPAFTDTSGIWHFYFDSSGNPITTQTPWSSFETIAPVYRLQWNATLSPDSAKSVVEGFECHLNNMSAADHAWKHKYGTIWSKGLDIFNNKLSTGTPNADGRNTVVAFNDGQLIDDNLPYDIVSGTGSDKWMQDLGNITPASLNATNSAQLKIRNRIAGLNYLIPATRFPFSWDSGTNIPNIINSSGTLVPVTNNYFFVYFVYGFSDPRNGFQLKLVSSTSDFATITTARAFNWVDIQNQYIDLTDGEVRPLYKLIFEKKSSYDAGCKYTVLRQVDDIRKAQITQATNASGSLPASSITVTAIAGYSSLNQQSLDEEIISKKAELSGADFTGNISIKGTGTNKTILATQETGDGSGHTQTFQNRTGLVANVDNISNDSYNRDELGIIINETFANITNWANVGSATFSVSSNQLQLTGGNNTYANYLRYDAYGTCNLDSWTLDMDFIPATSSASTYGLGIILKSAITGYELNITIKIDLTSTNFGKISVLYYENALNSTYTSDGKLTASTDLHHLRIKFIKNKLLIFVKNTVTYKNNIFEYEISSSTPYTALVPNSFKFGIIAFGGTHLVDNFIVTANDRKSSDFCFVGDSIVKGLYCDNISNRFSDLIGRLCNVVCLTNAGGGNRIENLNANEIIALTPEKIVLLVGVNNVRDAETASSVRTKINTLVNSLVSAGYVVGTDLYICSIMPNNATYDSVINAVNAYLITDYTTGYIDLYSALVLVDTFNPKYSNDGLHPNNKGHRFIADIIVSFLNIQNKQNIVGSYNPLFYNDNDKVSIASSKYQSSQPKSQLDIMSELGRHLHLGIDNSVGGGYVFSNGATNLLFGGGAYQENGTYYAAATTANLVVIDGGKISYYYNTGLTVGNSFSPTRIWYIDNTGFHAG